MQDNNRSFSHFSERTDSLASVMGVLLRDLPNAIGISDRMFYGYRSAKYPVTAKVWLKLEAAERAAGIRSSPHDADLKSDETADPEAKVNEYQTGYKKNLTVEERLSAVEAENAALREGLAEIFERLRPLVSGPRLKKGHQEGPP